MTVPRILFEGLGDLTDVVVFEQCELNIAAQGEASPSTMVVKDTGTPIEFKTGCRVTVDIDGDVIWAGFLLRASREFWFDVDTQTTSNRRWDLTLADVNLLFSKRIVFKQSTPKRIDGPVYRDPTYDDAIIDDLISDWLDLSADDVDTTTLVNQVGIVNPSSVGCNPPDQAFYPFNGSMQWGEAMNVISQMPAAIWGLLPGEPLGTSPFARLFYTDISDEDAPYELSDNPTASGVGYREMTIWEDGSDLVNEAFEWGAGKGANHMVFEHETASASITNHGLWQQGDLLFNIWCDTTIEKVADTIVNGSPTSRRGHKNPITSVEAEVDTDGFRVGQKVRFINEEFSFDEVLPIRRMQMTFPTPDTRRYKLMLNEEFDRWGFQDPTPPWKQWRCPDCGWDIPEPEPEPTATADVFDDFNRADTFWNSGNMPSDFFGVPSSVTNAVPWLTGSFFFTDANGQQIAGINAEGEFFYRVDMFNDGASSAGPSLTLEAFLDPTWFPTETITESAFIDAANEAFRQGVGYLTFRVWVAEWAPHAPGPGQGQSGETRLELLLEWSNPEAGPTVFEGGLVSFDLRRHGDGEAGGPQVEFDWDPNEGSDFGSLTLADTVDNEWHTFKLMFDWPNHTFAGKMWADSVAEPDWMWFGEDYGGDHTKFKFDWVYFVVDGDGASQGSPPTSMSLKIDDFLRWGPE